jgi:hypothetical protein
MLRLNVRLIRSPTFSSVFGTSCFQIADRTTGLLGPWSGFFNWFGQAGLRYHLLMVGPRDIADKPSLHDKGKLRSCGLGCLLSGAILFLFLLVFGAGLGLPYTYWLQIAEVQAFDGEDGVVLFVEVERAMRFGGFLQEGPINKAMQLLRIDVSKDGQVSQIPLKFDEDTTFNTNIAPIIRLPDHFYLVQQPSMGRPSCQLHRVDGDRIEPLSLEESRTILQAIGLRCGESRTLDDFEEFDLISKRSGWERLNRSSYMFEHDSPVVSNRHKLRLLFIKEDQFQAIVTESFSGPNHWSQAIVRVNTRRWKSYKSPMH